MKREDSILSQQTGDIILTPFEYTGEIETINSPENIPAALRAHIIPGAAIVVNRYNFGIVLSQKVEIRNYTAWHHRVQINSRVRLQMISNATQAMLMYTLSGSLSAILNGQVFSQPEGKYRYCIVGENMDFLVDVYPEVVTFFQVAVPQDVQLEMSQAIGAPVSFAAGGTLVIDPHMFSISAAALKRIDRILLIDPRSSRQSKLRSMAREEQLLGLLNQFFQDMDQLRTTQRWTSSGQIKLKELKKYAEDNLMEEKDDPKNPLRLQNLLRKLHLSHEQFRSAMQEEYRCGWKEFLHIIRINKAAQLLTEAPERSITDISFMLGYSVHTHFTRAFKQYYGITPSAYRKSKKAFDKED